MTDSKYSIQKEFAFEYAHRLTMDYDSPCKNIHGHSARIVVEIWTDDIDKNGMITDFSNLNCIKRFIDEEFDHKLILNTNDPILKVLTDQKECPVKIIALENIDPTSEVMADIIAKRCLDELLVLDVNIDKITVRFYETAKNSATVTLTNNSTVEVTNTIKMYKIVEELINFKNLDKITT